MEHFREKGTAIVTTMCGHVIIACPWLGHIWWSKGQENRNFTIGCKALGKIGLLKVAPTYDFVRFCYRSNLTWTWGSAWNGVLFPTHPGCALSVSDAVCPFFHQSLLSWEYVINTLFLISNFNIMQAGALIKEKSGHALQVWAPLLARTPSLAFYSLSLVAKILWIVWEYLIPGIATCVGEYACICWVGLHSDSVGIGNLQCPFHSFYVINFNTSQIFTPRGLSLRLIFMMVRWHEWNIILSQLILQQSTVLYTKVQNDIVKVEVAG